MQNATFETDFSFSSIFWRFSELLCSRCYVFLLHGVSTWSSVQKIFMVEEIFNFVTIGKSCMT